MSHICVAWRAWQNEGGQDPIFSPKVPSDSIFSGRTLGSLSSAQSLPRVAFESSSLGNMAQSTDFSSMFNPSKLVKYLEAELQSTSCEQTQVSQEIERPTSGRTIK